MDYYTMIEQNKLRRRQKISEIYHKTLRDGGYTHNAPNKGYVVSVPDFEKIVNIDDYESFEAVVDKYLRISEKLNLHLGTWRNKHFIYIDLNVILDLDSAIKLGKLYKQKCIYDLENDKILGVMEG